MKKHWSKAALVITSVVILLFACGAPATTPATQAPSPTVTAAPKTTTTTTPAATTTAAPAAKTKLVFAGNAVTMPGFSTIVGISDMLNKETNVNITIRSGAGPAPNGLAVDEGVADLATYIFSSLAQAYYGIGENTGLKPLNNLRLIFAHSPFKQSWLTTIKTGIKTIPDLKGKRVATFTAQADAYSYAFLEAYGLDPAKDVTKVKILNGAAATSEMSMGRIDAAPSRLAGAKMIEFQEQVGGPGVILPLAPDKFAWAANKYPELFVGSNSGYFEPGEQPGFELKRVPVMVTVDTIYVNKNVDEQAVYSMVKTMIKNVDKMGNMSMESKGLTLEVVAPISPIPYHPGAIKAFKEAGLWTAEHEKSQQRAVNNTTWGKWLAAR